MGRVFAQCVHATHFKAQTARGRQVWRAWSPFMRGGLPAPPQFPRLAYLFTQEQGMLWIPFLFYITEGRGLYGQEVS